MLIAGCSAHVPLLSPSGEPGGAEATLGWAFSWAMLFVLFVVITLLLAGLFRKRAKAAPTEITREGGGIKWIVGGGIIFPTVGIIVLFALVLAALSGSSKPSEKPYVGIFEVVGHRWWWEVRKVDENGRVLFVTANELHIPLGKPVKIRLSSADVIHSFWVPDLAGKTDAIPGQVNDAWLLARKPGSYVAQCAEYCGMQHAHMAMRVIAEDSAAYGDWITRQENNAVEPADSATMHGREVFLGAPCSSCHQIRGTPAGGIVGPDLTHLGSRQTIGAGSVPNTVGNLAGWIINSQGIKPGNSMPPIDLPARDLQSLVAYLSSLK